MANTRMSSADHDLRALAARFAHWRRTRAAPRERIPAALWEHAATLSTVLLLSRVAQTLRLSRGAGTLLSPAPLPNRNTRIESSEENHQSIEEHTRVVPYSFKPIVFLCLAYTLFWAGVWTALYGNYLFWNNRSR